MTDPAVDAYLRGDADAFADLCAPDVLLDINVPTWQYQLKGRPSLRQVLTEEFPPGRTVANWRSVPTADGLLFEAETHVVVDGEQRRWREITWLRGTPAAWTEVVVFCTGIWDAATIARHAVEAPMVTP